MSDGVIKRTIFGLNILLWSPYWLTDTRAEDQKWRMDDPLVEIDLLDPNDAPIRRYAFTAARAPAREMPIPTSRNLCCTLAHDHNVVLNYYPDIDTWVFQEDATAEARLAAGGIATCLDLTRVGRKQK